jgi:hypothetical protein
MCMYMYMYACMYMYASMHLNKQVKHYTSVVAYICASEYRIIYSSYET